MGGGGMIVFAVFAVAVILMIAYFIIKGQEGRKTAPTDEKDLIRRVKVNLSKDQMLELGNEIAKASTTGNNVNYFVDGREPYVLEIKVKS